MSLALLVLSSEEILTALHGAGFQLVRRQPELVVVARGPRVVSVPHAAMIGDAELADLLRAAGVTYHELLEELDGMPASPAQRNDESEVTESGVRPAVRPNGPRASDLRGLGGDER